VAPLSQPLSGSLGIRTGSTDECTTSSSGSAVLISTCNRLSAPDCRKTRAATHAPGRNKTSKPWARPRPSLRDLVAIERDRVLAERGGKQEEGVKELAATAGTVGWGVTSGHPQEAATRGWCRSRVLDGWASPTICGVAGGQAGPCDSSSRCRRNPFTSITAVTGYERKASRQLFLKPGARR